MLVELTKPLVDERSRAHALASALGNISDQALVSHRADFVRDIRERLPAWLIDGLREVAQ
jgi:hypothetical protein